MARTRSKEIEGLPEALRVIGRTDKELRRQLTKDFAQAASPMLEEAISKLPKNPPLSGMVRNWRGKPFWSQREAGKRGVRIKLDSRRPRRQLRPDQETVGVLRLQTRTRMTAVYDMAGKANEPSNQAGAAFIRGLNRRNGKASRMMWPSAESTMDEVQDNLRPVIRKVMEAQSKALK